MPKILWMSPYSLHDISSGASIHCRYILESLQQSGCEVWSYSSFFFDRPEGATTTFGNLDSFFAQWPQSRLLQFDDRGIHYIYLKSSTTKEMMHCSREQEEFFTHFIDVLNIFKPDIVIGYGTGMDSYTCFAEAQRRGYATVYLLLNGKHAHFTFPHLDLVLTDSQTTAQLYAERDGMNCTAIGQFIDASKVVASEHDPKYVTMVNPDLSKGVSIFAKLALACKHELPDLKFMTVDSRAYFADSVKKLHEQGSNDHPYTMADFPNVVCHQPTADMRIIYREMKIAVVPSLAYESWGRIASEAQLNGIPVLGTTTGGIAEAINEGGLVLPAPQHCLADISELPTDEEIRPFVAALRRLLVEDWSAPVKRAASKVSREILTRHLIDVLSPYFNKKPSEHIQLLRG